MKEIILEEEKEEFKETVILTDKDIIFKWYDYSSNYRGWRLGSSFLVSKENFKKVVEALKETP